MFSRDIQSEFLKKIGKDNLIKDQIRNRECIKLGYDYFLSIDTNSNDEAHYWLFIFIIKIIAFLFLIFLPFLPYLIQLFPLYVLLCTLSFKEKDYIIISISLVNAIFSLVSFISIYGCFVSCCCLYHPSNWILFMALIDLISLISDLYLGYCGFKGPEEYQNLWISYFHALILFYNLIRQIGLYIAFKKVYKIIREQETLIIKKCIEEFAKEKNLYNV